MSVIDIIKQRRSVREYTDEIPSEEDILTILEAGIWAPSGLNNQPWKFKIAAGSLKDDIAGLTKYSHVIKAAPAAICVFLDSGSMYNRDKDILAIGACIQNMLLTAHSMGYGTCWLGEILKRKDDVNMLMNVSGCYELMAVITIGRPVDNKQRSDRDPLDTFFLK